MMVLIAILVCVPLVYSIVAVSACVLSARISRRAERPVPAVTRDGEPPVALSVSLSPH